MSGHHKKRSSLSEILSPGHISSFSTASALSRQPLPGRVGQQIANVLGGGSTRASTSEKRGDTSSPPASSYFSRKSIELEDADPVPASGSAGDVGSHFAYSTTLRRHLGGLVGTGNEPLLPMHASSLEKGVAGNNEEQEPLWRGAVMGDGSGEETPASLFARRTIEVSCPALLIRLIHNIFSGNLLIL